MGGAEIMCENLTYQLKALGVDVIVVSFFDMHTPITDRMEKAGVNVRYLGKKRGFDVSMIRKLRRLFKKERPDAIHTHINTMYYAIPAAFGIVKCKIHTVHSLADKECGESFSRKCNRFCCKYLGVTPVALSSVVQDSIEYEYKIKKEKIPIIFNGIDLSKCRLKTDYTIQDQIKILHIGRLSEEKNHFGLIKAFSIFHEKYRNSVLQLIGEGPLRAKIEAYIYECGIQDSVQLLGAQSNVYGYLQQADIFALPSFYEGVPMTLIEAMGTGLPIVATCVGGIPEMLENGTSALLTDVNNEQLADCFAVLAQSEELRRRLGEKAKAESIRFSSKIMGEKYANLYK